MPYIHEERRRALARGQRPKNPGELNFVITTVVLDYLDPTFRRSMGYQDYNDALGALEGAKLELYRRRVAPYEDIKIEENGDLYGYHTATAPEGGRQDEGAEHQAESAPCSCACGTGAVRAADCGGTG